MDPGHVISQLLSVRGGRPGVLGSACLMAQHRMAWYGEAWHSTEHAQHGMSWHSFTWRSWHGMAWHGTAQPNKAFMARHGGDKASASHCRPSRDWDPPAIQAHGCRSPASSLKASSVTSVVCCGAGACWQHQAGEEDVSLVQGGGEGGWQQGLHPLQHPKLLTAIPATLLLVLFQSLTRDQGRANIPSTTKPKDTAEIRCRPKQHGHV